MSPLDGPNGSVLLGTTVLHDQYGAVLPVHTASATPITSNAAVLPAGARGVSFDVRLDPDGATDVLIELLVGNRADGVAGVLSSTTVAITAAQNVLVPGPSAYNYAAIRVTPASAGCAVAVVASARRALEGFSAPPAPPAETVASILGPLFVDEWDSTITCTSTLWTSANARALTNVGAVTRSADGSNFATTPVIGSNKSVPAYMAGVVASLGAVASQPYVLLVCRLAAGFTNGDNLCSFSNDAAPEQDFTFFVNGTKFSFFNGTVVDGPTADAAVHMFEAWNDGTTSHFAVDGIDATGGGPQPLANPMINLHLGAGFAGASPTTGFFARAVVASAAPTGPQRAALLALLQTRYGF